ncbi:unnamed protein product [Pararhodospirillum photometricum DSM 122]|uniref:Uncharacterized protein n=1 Tax=Pararhodospirillum photometricum DSM 122 TaxID=1150469 RepID=H6SLU5_PARPM|nr:unnamed protein product [Pararhodospirillum photometricum DSM 122]
MQVVVFKDCLSGPGPHCLHPVRMIQNFVDPTGQRLGIKEIHK